eukprot:gnl/MRDRNA2_/MRDRNA2_95599_c0_seq1.p1 gnl/MRDRNA2_/MRDRNA2_95599_c0~~gnl/MRDRNA2_/MRDRNA2_95599_c0_seq1.p1  ORF type:complete len:407 (+),score=102.05 gnl/MRDRNA2_/MRDRNA2_95599_c0_seq1:71-1291(+)
MATSPDVVRHIQLLKFKDGVSSGQRGTVLDRFSALPKAIPSILSFQVGFDMGLPVCSGFHADLAITAEFRSSGDYEAYVQHQEFASVVADAKALLVPNGHVSMVLRPQEIIPVASDASKAKASAAPSPAKAKASPAPAPEKASGYPTPEKAKDEASKEMPAALEDQATRKENDLAEAKRLLALAKRPMNIDRLKTTISRIENRGETETPAPVEKPAPSQPASKPEPHKPVPVDVRSVGPWTEIKEFSLDLGKYNDPTVKVEARLKGVGSIPKENVTCDFQVDSFDLKVMGLDGKDYRMKKTSLDKDIVPENSTVIVKPNKVVVTLGKVKGEYGYDSWTDLVSKRRSGGKAPEKGGKKDDPMAGLMNIMQDMYEDGDDQTRKMIGEAMLKSRSGEKMPTPGESLDDF